MRLELMTRQTQSSSKIAQILFGLLAYVSLGIGLIAIVIPGLPTTEFILLAAWAATKSSPRLSAWLENHRLFGPILSNCMSMGNLWIWSRPERLPSPS